MNYTKVEQEEMIALEAENNGLWTEGISTCIGIMIQGSVDSKPFIAMYHWEGFSAYFDKKSASPATLKSEIAKVFRSLRNEIRKSLGSNTRPILNCVFHVGGEKETEELTGTALEVETLQRYGCVAVKKYFKCHDGFVFKGRNFVTEGNESLRLKFVLDNVMIVNDNTPDPELDDDFEQDDLNSPGFRI